MITKFKKFNENLGFDLVDQKYEVRFKQGMIVFTVFTNVECGKKEYGPEKDNAYRSQDISIVKDGIRDVEMEILMEAGDTMMVNIDMVHQEEDNIDISAFSLCNALQYGDTYHGYIDVSEYSPNIKSSSCGIILKPLIKNGVMMSLSLNDIEIKGIHY